VADLGRRPTYITNGDADAVARDLLWLSDAAAAPGGGEVDTLCFVSSGHSYRGTERRCSASRLSPTPAIGSSRPRGQSPALFARAASFPRQEEGGRLRHFLQIFPARIEGLPERCQLYEVLANQ